MANLDAVRETVIKGLENYLNVQVIRSNQTGEIPKYPYLSYTITTPMSADNGTWGEYGDGKARKPFTQTWSITAQSDNYGESLNLAVKAREWLDRAGRTYLNDNGVIVQSVGGIANRDNLITLEYEYRQGFDAVLWLMDELPLPGYGEPGQESEDFDSVIEHLTVNGREYHRTVT